MSSESNSNIHQIRLTAVKSCEPISYEFEAFRLDAEHLMLYRDGKELSATPKQVETLLALVEHAGEIVSKDALMARLWGTAAVEESNLVQNIYLLRKILGETSDGEPVIETLRRRGYRFNARLKSHIRQENGSNGQEFSDSSPKQFELLTAGSGSHLLVTPKINSEQETRSSDRPFLSSGRVVWTCGALGVAMLAVLVGLSGYFRSAVTPRSIVVLPVAPVTPEDRNDRYALGIADSLINRLASAEGVVVRPLSSVREYAETVKDPVAVGREQKTDYVIAATYQIADGKIKITGQLYNVKTGAVEYTLQKQTSTTDPFKVQDEVAADFGDQLIERFGGSSLGPVKPHPTNNEEAYHLYQQAAILIDKRSDNNSETAKEYLEQAVELDPNYAQAWAALALAIRHSGRTDADRIHQEIVEAANRALAIDPSVSDAYVALCYDKLHYDYDLAGAATVCKKGVDVNPNSSTAHRAYAWTLRFGGRYDEALTEIRKAIDLEPVSYVNQRDYAYVLDRSGQYDEAVAQWKRIITIDPTDPVPYQQIIRPLEKAKKESEAFEWFLKLLEIRHADAETVQRYTDIYQSSAWRGVVLERATDHGAGALPDGNFPIAKAYAYAGETDKAFEYLEKSFEKREWNFAGLWESPELDSLRSDPRYAELLQKVDAQKTQK